MFKRVTYFSAFAPPVVTEKIYEMNFIKSMFESMPEPKSLSKSAESASGFAMVDDLMLEMCIDPMSQWYLPLELVKLEKAIDKAALKFETDKRAREIGEMEGRTVGKKEKASIKDRIMAEMILTAPTKRKTTKGYLVLKNNNQMVLMVDATTVKAGEFAEKVQQLFGLMGIRFGIRFEPMLFGNPDDLNKACIRRVVTNNTSAFSVTLGEDEDFITIEDCTGLPDELIDRIDGHGEFLWVKVNYGPVSARLTANHDFRKVLWEDFEGGGPVDGDGYSSAMNRLEFGTYLSMFEAFKQVGEPE